MVHRSVRSRPVAIALLLAITSSTLPGRAEDPPPAPAPAAADAPAALGDDEVTLKNGGILRGTVISVDPGNEVTIVVAGKPDPRVIPWAEVADVQRGKFAAAAAPQPAPPPIPGYGPTPVGPPPQAGPTVRLHVECEEPVDVWEHMGTSVGQGWGGTLVVTHHRAVCTAPCDVEVPAMASRQYYFQADGIPASSSFSLGGRAGGVTAHVDPGSTGMKVGGWVMVGVGGAAAVAGVLFTVMGHTLNTYELDEDFNEIEEPAFEEGKIIGPILIGGGLGLVGGGIALIILGRTTYELEDTPRTARGERVAQWWKGEF